MATPRKLKTERRVVRSESRIMINDIYQFLRTEHDFTRTYKYCACDLSHLNNITQRTADAAGISMRTAQRIMQEIRTKPEGGSSSDDEDKELEKGDPGEVHEMICDVYRFLQQERDFTKTYKYCSCDLTHLNNVGQRTADATCVHRTTVSKLVNTAQPKKRKRNDSKRESKKTSKDSKEEDAEHQPPFGEGCSKT